jgi:transketolase
MRDRFANTFYQLGKEDERLAVIVADISPAGSIVKFREEFPDRFINTGVAEQVMIGMAAGMAQRGMRPFAYTIATFALFRPFEMVRLDLGYQNLPVTVVGIGGGVSYSTLGGTHHAMEDIAVASVIPNMQVVAPCDPDEVDLMTRYLAIESMRPTYMRLGKAGEPILTARADPFVFGKLRYLQRGSDICILSYSTAVKEALEIAAAVKEGGKSVSVISVHTIKPLDRPGVEDALRSHPHVVVIEEHVPHGGLGSRVKEIAWEIKAGCRLDHFSLQDDFIHSYGSHDSLLECHAMSNRQILEKISS